MYKQTNRMHKHTRTYASLAASSLTELIQAREELLEELNHMLKCKFTLTQILFYKFSNTFGKLLGRALKAKRAAHTIHNIRNPSGDTLLTTEDISG